MRNTIILGSLLALIGLGAAVAQASDQAEMINQDAMQATREASNDGRGDRRHQYEATERSRHRSHESREHRRKSNDGTETHERREHQDRR
jgi:hypothetical protein